MKTYLIDELPEGLNLEDRLEFLKEQAELRLMYELQELKKTPFFKLLKHHEETGWIDINDAVVPDYPSLVWSCELEVNRAIANAGWPSFINWSLVPENEWLYSILLEDTDSDTLNEKIENKILVSFNDLSFIREYILAQIPGYNEYQAVDAEEIFRSYPITADDLKVCKIKSTEGTANEEPLYSAEKIVEMLAGHGIHYDESKITYYVKENLKWNHISGKYEDSFVKKKIPFSVISRSDPAYKQIDPRKVLDICFEDEIASKCILESTMQFYIGFGINLKKYYNGHLLFSRFLPGETIESALQMDESALLFGHCILDWVEYKKKPAYSRFKTMSSLYYQKFAVAATTYFQALKRTYPTIISMLEDEQTAETLIRSLIVYRYSIIHKYSDILSGGQLKRFISHYVEAFQTLNGLKNGATGFNDKDLLRAVLFAREIEVTLRNLKLEVIEMHEDEEELRNSLTEQSIDFISEFIEPDQVNFSDVPDEIILDLVNKCHNKH